MESTEDSKKQFNTRPGELFQVQMQNGVLPEDIWRTKFEGDTYHDAVNIENELFVKGFKVRIVSNQRGVI